MSKRSEPEKLTAGRKPRRQNATSKDRTPKTSCVQKTRTSRSPAASSVPTTASLIQAAERFPGGEVRASEAALQSSAKNLADILSQRTDDVAKRIVDTVVERMAVVVRQEIRSALGKR